MSVFTVIVRRLWVWKSKSEGSQGVFGLRRGPWLHKSVGFGVSRAAETLRFQLNEELLRWKLGWMLLVTVFFKCLWVWKEKTDMSEAVYRLGSGPWHQNLVGFGVSRAAETLAQISAQ